MSAWTKQRSWCRRAGFFGFLTVSPLLWDIGRKASGFTYVVPVGFVFDVSVPPALRWLISPEDPHFLKAACLHDHMLRHGWDRRTAGAVFHEALAADGVGRALRLAMWLAVSLWKWN